MIETVLDNIWSGGTYLLWWEGRRSAGKISWRREEDDGNPTQGFVSFLVGIIYRWEANCLSCVRVFVRDNRHSFKIASRILTIFADAYESACLRRIFTDKFLSFIAGKYRDMSGLYGLYVPHGRGLDCSVFLVNMNIMDLVYCKRSNQCQIT